MCRRAGRRAGIALFLIVGSALAATDVDAQQDVSERERELVDQLERLVVHRQELQATARVLDSIQEVKNLALRTTKVDTATVGPFWVVATPEQLDEAVEVYEAAWAKIAATLGDWSPTGKDRGFVFQRTRDTYMQSEFLWQSRLGVQVRPWHPRSRAVSLALVALEKRIYLSALPKEVRQWASGVGLRDRQPMEYAYRNLIVTPAESARDCFEGDADRCWDALGLRNADSSWESWYDAAERREWVFNTYDAELADFRCGEGDAQCLSYLNQRQPQAPVPAAPLTRASFLGHALRTGGSGALGRLQEGDESTPLIKRLVQASGASRDALITSWRGEVLASAPPEQTTLSLKLLSGGLFWSLVLSGFAMRSTRWRA